MKTTFTYLLLPLAVACTGKQKTQSSTQISQSLKSNEPTRIIGVVSYNEKCNIDKQETQCLSIQGGDDLNDTKTFVLNQNKNGFEVIDDKTNPKTFRIWTASKEKPIEVFENEHVSLLADLVDSPPNEAQQIGKIETVARLDK